MANREQLIDKLDYWYDIVCGMGMASTAEDILFNNNASEDDSDPDEGFMVTMSDEDIANAIAELKEVHDKINPQTLQAMIYALNSGTQEVTRDYQEGFLDACSWFADEYGIELDGLEE